MKKQNPVTGADWEKVTVLWDCPTCDNRQTSPRIETDEDGSYDEYDEYECGDCHHTFEPCEMVIIDQWAWEAS